MDDNKLYSIKILQLSSDLLQCVRHELEDSSHVSLEDYGVILIFKIPF